jgi:hypothetical protein
LSAHVDGLQEPAQAHGSRAASPMGMVMPAPGSELATPVFFAHQPALFVFNTR